MFPEARPAAFLLFPFLTNASFTSEESLVDLKTSRECRGDILPEKLTIWKRLRERGLQAGRRYQLQTQNRVVVEREQKVT